MVIIMVSIMVISTVIIEKFSFEFAFLFAFCISRPKNQWPSLLHIGLDPKKIPKKFRQTHNNDNDDNATPKTNGHPFCITVWTERQYWFNAAMQEVPLLSPCTATAMLSKIFGGKFKYLNQKNSDFWREI